MANPLLRFTFTLTHDLNGGTREELMDRMGGSELVFWIAWYQLKAKDDQKALNEIKRRRRR